MSNGPVAIPDADAYAATLADKGRVMASFEGRRADIERQLLDHAGRLSATLGDDPEVAALLDEVTALVEHPTVYVGEFEEQFLQVPQECLILTMRLNQKYFPLFDPASGRLTHRFLIVSNMHTANPVNIVEGNQRVVRPRLADAQFFFNTDRKTPLAARVEQLGAIVYHNKLGTQLERVERVRAIARGVAQQLAATSRPPTAPPCWPRPTWARTWWASSPSCKASWARTTRPATANRPAWSRRCAPVPQPLRRPGQRRHADRRHAVHRRTRRNPGRHLGHRPGAHRRARSLRPAPRRAGPDQRLRAAGRGWLKINQDGPLSLDDLLDLAAGTFPAGKIPADTLAEVRAFIYERYRNQLIADSDRNAVEAVIALTPPLHQVGERVRAVAAFAQMPEAASLAAANKRIGNLLKKAEGEIGQVNDAALVEPAEKALAASVATLRPQAEAQFATGDFAASLRTLAQAREPVDAFFADVMVMAEDPAVRANRLALLGQLHGLMNQVADISRLAQ